VSPLPSFPSELGSIASWFATLLREEANPLSELGSIASLSATLLREEANPLSELGSIASWFATLLREEADIGSRRVAFVEPQASFASE